MNHHNFLLEGHPKGYWCKVSLLPLKIVMNYGQTVLPVSKAFNCV